MTKLAIIPCTVFLETAFLGKKFRYISNAFCFATFSHYDFIILLFARKKVCWSIWSDKGVSQGWDGYMILTVLKYWHCSRSIQLSLSILLLGVGIATVTDLQLNLLGSVLSLLAIITTCIAQIVSLYGKLFPLFLAFNQSILILSYWNSAKLRI